MKQIIEAFKTLFNSSPTPHTKIKLIKSRNRILQALRTSLENGNVVGVYSRVLGNGMLLVGVEEITTYKTEDVIIFKRYDQSGIPLQATRLLLSEIRTVCPFDTKFRDPLNEKNSSDQLVNEEELAI